MSVASREASESAGQASAGTPKISFSGEFAVGPLSRPYFTGNPRARQLPNFYDSHPIIEPARMRAPGDADACVQ
jgi:hypothetical protein